VIEISREYRVIDVSIPATATDNNPPYGVAVGATLVPNPLTVNLGDLGTRRIGYLELVHFDVSLGYTNA
jgi:hypothetical protein